MPDFNGTALMETANTSFLIEKWGADCGPVQFLREFTQNAMEGINKLPSKAGKILWTPATIELEGTHQTKLSVLDTGCGMNAEELKTYLNKLSSTGSAAGAKTEGNFGIGAKISALSYNPYGIIYYSLKDGKGNKIWLHLGEEGFGAKRWSDNFIVSDVDLKDFPQEIINAGHGTVVYFLGQNLQEDTYDSLQVTPKESSKRLTKYLNGKYLNISQTIELYTKNSVKANSQLTRAKGLNHHLSIYTLKEGKVKFQDFEVHWKILNNDAATAPETVETPLKYHVAAIKGDEVYQLLTSSAGMAKIRASGIYSGEKNIVLHFKTVGSKYQPNGARTDLTYEGKSIPWEEWTYEFSKNLPLEIEEYLEEAVKENDVDRASKVNDPVKDFLSSFGVRGLKPSKRGSFTADPLAAMLGEKRASGTRNENEQAEDKKEVENPRKGNLASSEKGQAAKMEGEILLPDWEWVSQEDKPEDLTGRAAFFVPNALNGRGYLYLNSDFSLFKDLTDHIMEKVKLDASNVKFSATAQELVQNHFSSILIESIVSFKHLIAKSRHAGWGAESKEIALSSESLTLVCIQCRVAATELVKSLRSELKARGYQNG